MAACEMVRCTDGEGRVLDWHLETAKGDHFATICDMKVVQRGLAQFRGCRFMADGRDCLCWEKMLSWGSIGDAGLGGGRA